MGHGIGIVNRLNTINYKFYKINWLAADRCTAASAGVTAPQRGVARPRAPTPPPFFGGCKGTAAFYTIGFVNSFEYFSIGAPTTSENRGCSFVALVLYIQAQIIVGVKSLEYREARIKDLESLMGLCVMFHGESRWVDYELCLKKLGSFIVSFIEGSDRVVFVAERDGVLVGCIFGELTSMFWSNDLSVYDRMWYVEPDNRGTLVGVRLLKSLIDWSRARGAKEFFVGHSSGIARGRSDLLLRRLGLDSVATLYGRIL